MKARQSRGARNKAKKNKNISFKFRQQNFRRKARRSRQRAGGLGCFTCLALGPDWVPPPRPRQRHHVAQNKTGTNRVGTRRQLQAGHHMTALVSA